MYKWTAELNRRNPLLYRFGQFNFFAAAACLIFMAIDERQLLGVSVWNKPMKFFLSLGILSWTMCWILEYLDNRKIVRRYSITLVVTMMLETIPISIQSLRGVTSHYNMSSSIDNSIFLIMGIAIAAFTVWSIIICIAFFRQKTFNIPSHLVWAIRLGLVIFIIASIEGGLMVQLLKHTIGAEDGGTGLPFVNWSKTAGDLRVAHFFGIHALQIIPVAACYLLRSSRYVFWFSGFYFLFVISMFAQAMKGIPLLAY